MYVIMRDQRNKHVAIETPSHQVGDHLTQRPASVVRDRHRLPVQVIRQTNGSAHHMRVHLCIVMHPHHDVRVRMNRANLSHEAEVTR